MSTIGSLNESNFIAESKSSSSDGVELIEVVTGPGEVLEVLDDEKYEGETFLFLLSDLLLDVIPYTEGLSFLGSSLTLSVYNFKEDFSVGERRDVLE